MICLKLLFSSSVFHMWMLWRLKASEADVESFFSILDSCNQLEHKLTVTWSDDFNPFNQCSYAKNKMDYFTGSILSLLKKYCCPSMYDYSNLDLDYVLVKKRSNVRYFFLLWKTEIFVIPV